MNNNIFAVTRLGQLRNVKGFIKQFNSKNNILVVIYTTQNMELVDNLRKNIEDKFFSKVVYLKLPVRPLRFGVKKCKDIYSRIVDTYIDLHKEYHYEHIFLCNTDNFYKYFEDVAQKTNSELILLEEGLTTYRMFSKEMKRSFNWRDVKSEFKRFIKSIKNVFVHFVVLVLKTLSWIFNKNLVDLVKHARIPKKYKYGYISHFEKAYVCFPGKMRDMATKDDIGEINKLNFYLDKDVDKKLLNKLDDNMTLFINQKYVPYNKHFNIIFDILEREGIEKITFKFHPKESPIHYQIPLEEAMELHPNMKVKVLKGFDHIPVENLLSSGKINRVVGLTTSALIYTTIINPNVEVLSIAKSYKHLCLSDKYNVDAKRMELYKRDYAAFDKLFDIEQV